MLNANKGWNWTEKSLTEKGCIQISAFIPCLKCRFSVTSLSPCRSVIICVEEDEIILNRFAEIGGCITICTSWGSAPLSFKSTDCRNLIYYSWSQPETSDWWSWSFPGVFVPQKGTGTTIEMWIISPVSLGNFRQLTVHYHTFLQFGAWMS